MFDHFAVALENARPLLQVPSLAPFPTIAKLSAPVPAAALPAAALRNCAAAMPAPRSSSTNDNAGRRILTAIAQNNRDGATHRKIGILADVSPGGSTWRGCFARFRKEGLIEERGDVVFVTPAGVRELGQYEPLPTGDALREYWRARIGNGTRGAIFEAVCRRRGAPAVAEVVAEESGVELGGSTWRGHMAKLRGLYLVSGSDELRANEELFG